MWKKISNFENNTFYLKYIIANEIYYFYLTNFINIWETQINKDSLRSIFKEKNPLLQASNSSFVNCCIDLLFKNISSPTTKSIFKYEQDQKIELCFHIREDSFTINLPFEFSLSNPETFCEHVTLPMAVMLKEKYDSEEQLMNLLSKKDLEILEYKNEGAVLPDHIKQTKPFDMKKHKETHKSSKDFLQDNNILDVSNKLCESFGVSDKNIVMESVTKKAIITPKKDVIKTVPLIKNKVKEEDIVNILAANAVKQESTSSMFKTKRNNKRKINL